jgi:hypothetical protein
MIDVFITCSRAALRIMMHKFLISLPPSAPILTLERRVRMAEDALFQAQQDLDAGRERHRLQPEPAQPASVSHPTREELAEFILRAGAKRRGDTVLDDEPKINRIIDQRVGDPAAVAAAILAAAAKARSKT